MIRIRGWLMVVACAGCATPRQLWFGGDVHLGQGGAERLRAVSEALSPARGVVNLEGPIGREPESAGVDGGVRLSNGPQTGEVLAQLGIVAAGIANNHAGDLGEPGRTATRAALEAAGVRTFGTTVIRLSGLRVVLTANDLGDGVPAELPSQLSLARARGEVLVATFHVTGPPLLLPSPELKQAVEIALAAGATVVLAHGTHALASVERRGDAVIAWGLGNLSFECDCTDETDGLVLAIDFEANGHVSRATVVPIAAGLRGANAHLSEGPKLVLDLLESLGARPVRRLADRAEF